MAQNNIWPRHRQTRRPSTLNPNVAKAFALGTDAITDGRERANRPENFPRLHPAITSLSHPSLMLRGFRPPLSGGMEGGTGRGAG